jgi:S-adenosylmethionine synthetase
MGYIFTSESVSEGHPDKVSDQISDALVDEYLRRDPNSKVACETLVTTGLVVLAGEVKSNGVFDQQEIARKTIAKIGYTKAEYKFDAESCGVINTIHGQSQDINQGVERTKKEDQGAGDQGMMFGYASNETDNYMPATLDIAHSLLQVLADIRRDNKVMKYLRPDAKSQVTIEYDDKNGKPKTIKTIVISTQHDDFVKPADDSKAAHDAAALAMQAKIREDVEKYVIPRTCRTLPSRLRKLFDELEGQKFELYVNPTGNFVIGGPHGDTGLTGRKIIVDSYGGKGAHGGGAFSGKDSSKVDRSAAYATRHIAKNLVAAGICKECLVQVAYAIGVAKPMGLYVNTYGTCKLRNPEGRRITDIKLAEIVGEMFDMRPAFIVERFGLTNPIFGPTASYGHFGRKPYTETVQVFDKNGKEGTKEVEFFTWEKLDYVQTLKRTFNILY